MLRFIGQFGVLLLVLWMSGCAPRISESVSTEPVDLSRVTTQVERLTIAPEKETQSPAPEPTVAQSGAPTITPEQTPLQQKQTPAISSPLPDRIASGRILDSWWSLDSTILYYELPGQMWAYYIDDCTTKELSAGELSLGTPQPDIFSRLPTDAEDISVSPSGGLILYLISLEPTPTVPPSASPADEGEAWLGGEAAELWFWDGVVSHRVGQLEHCVDEYFWANGEQKAVITALPAPAVCRETRAWLVDLKEVAIFPLFPKDDFPSEVVASGISPDGKRLLYGYMDDLVVLDLDTYDHAKLDTPLGSSGQWIGNNNLLISYRAQNGAPWVLGTYSLLTTELVELVNPQITPALEGLRILGERVSPDGHWLAFAAGESIYEIDGLWLMRLDPDE